MVLVVTLFLVVQDGESMRWHDEDGGGACNHVDGNRGLSDGLTYGDDGDDLPSRHHSFPQTARQPQRQGSHRTG